MNSVEKVRIVSIAAITLLLTTAISLNAAEVGPAKGSLVLVGGNMRDDAIVKRIIDLAGGPDELIVIIPTAGGAREYNQDYRVVGQFRASGAKNLEVMHTYDRGVADSEKFIEPLRRARGVFFGDGRPWRLADAYLHADT
jgi:cyanophycinase-like exopeptidase